VKWEIGREGEKEGGKEGRKEGRKEGKQEGRKEGNVERARTGVAIDFSLGTGGVAGIARGWQVERQHVTIVTNDSRVFTLRLAARFCYLSSRYESRHPASKSRVSVISIGAELANRRGRRMVTKMLGKGHLKSHCIPKLLFSTRRFYRGFSRTKKAG